MIRTARRPTPLLLTAAAAIGLAAGYPDLATAAEQTVDGRTFTLPDGFTLERAAGPPLVDRPITADFDERPALFDVRKAFDADAPEIHAEGNWYRHFEDEMDRRQIRKGNIEEAFDKADLIVQGVYRPAAIEHAPIETQVCQVVPEAKVVAGTPEATVHEHHHRMRCGPVPRHGQLAELVATRPIRVRAGGDGAKLHSSPLTGA